MGLSYPLFFMGSVIIAIVIFYLRTRSQSLEVGLVVGQNASAPVEQIPNITQRLNQQAAGTYDPYGSAATSASYPGV